MPDVPVRRSLSKRILLVIGGFAVFTLLFVIATRLAVLGIFRGIEANKGAGLASISPFERHSAAANLITWGSTWISRNASLQLRTVSFDESVVALHRIVAEQHSYLEDLRTESTSGHGRELSCSISVPASDFEPAISSLKTVGRIETISEAGEDSAVKLATSARHLVTAQTNLSRLQKLQRERKGELRDAVALEKDIAQANETVVEAEHQNQGLLSTVAQAHIRVRLMEDYRATLRTNLAAVVLRLRNALVEGVGAIFSTSVLVLGAIFEFGLPLLFWAALLFIPARFGWLRFRRAPAVLPAAH